MTASKIFLYCCFSFISGIVLNSFLKIPQLTMPGFLILGIGLISIFWKYLAGPRSQIEGGANGAGKKFVLAGFCLLFLVAGIWQHQSAKARGLKSELGSFNNRGENTTLIGIVGAEPAIGEKSTKLTIKSEQLTISNKVLVMTNRYPEYQYGDKLKIVGKIESPPIFESFNYRDYLKKDGIYLVMNFPEIELIGQGFGNPIYEVLFSFKNKFKETTRTFISPPQEGILEALIFGDEGNISKEWKEKLNLTGTRHIAAVSGMNITIISALLFNLLLGLGFWRNQAFYLSLILLVIYILMVGAPASAVRAGIMGMLFLAGQHFGRLSAASRAIVFAATLMLAFNPLLLGLDVGFQLSFLAMMGIIYLQPVFSSFLKKMPSPKFFPLRTTFSTTLSAQIFTLPILVYNFGYIPILSLMTNILIVPFLAPLTILIFVFGILAMLFWPLGFLLSLPTWFFLTYLVELIDWFSKLPFVSLTMENTPWIWLIISYSVLGLITWRLQEKFTRPSFLR